MRCRILIAITDGTLVLAMGAGVASGGEITGNGKSFRNEDETRNGRSECAFSGLDDGDVKACPKTQNWGQLDKGTRAFLASIGYHPGFARNASIASRN